MYIESRMSRYRSSTALRLTFRLGVNSPSSTVKSRSRISNFLIVSHLFNCEFSSSIDGLDLLDASPGSLAISAKDAAALPCSRPTPLQRPGRA